MPSDLAYWLISAPSKLGGESALFETVKTTVGDEVGVGGLEMPQFKAGTLSSLLTLSDSLPKTDAYFTTTVTKLLDTLRSLLSAPPPSMPSSSAGGMGEHARVNDMPVDSYILPKAGSGDGWKWDVGRWGAEGKVGEVVDALNKEMTSIDTIQRTKLSAYSLTRGTLLNLSRKSTGNLSQRTLVGIVPKGACVEDSEYLETLLVAVPNNLVKQWEAGYERLTGMVVPRSSSKITSDSEFTLQTVTIFKKVHDEFLHKCREAKYIVRDFKWEEEAEEKMIVEKEGLEREERELWSDLLRLSRTNFSEAYQLLTHLKVVRVFVESVLRYGLPAEYSAMIIKPNPKTSLKTLRTLSSNKYLSNAQSSTKDKDGKGKSSKSGNEEIAGEWAAAMEGEYFSFVLMELPEVIV